MNLHYNNSLKRNFPDFTTDELEQKYKNIISIYGDSMTKRVQFAHQGKPNTNRIKTSKYIGVHFYTKKGKWQSQISKDGKRYHMGYFDCEVDAAEAYNIKAIELYGEYARINNFE